MLRTAVASAVAYGLGCVTCGYYVTRYCTGQDIRCLGSGNAGTRNVQRTMGARAAAVTLLGDVSKGALAVRLAGHLAPGATGAWAATLAATAGHVWPAQLGFRGGKGAAPAGGALLASDPALALGVIAVFAPLVAVSGRFTASGLAAVCCLPGLASALGRPPTEIRGAALLTVLVSFAHRADVRTMLLPHRWKGRRR